MQATLCDAYFLEHKVFFIYELRVVNLKGDKLYSLTSMFLFIEANLFIINMVTLHIKYF